MQQQQQQQQVKHTTNSGTRRYYTSKKYAIHTNAPSISTGRTKSGFGIGLNELWTSVSSKSSTKQILPSSASLMGPSRPSLATASLPLPGGVGAAAAPVAGDASGAQKQQKKRSASVGAAAGGDADDADGPKPLFDAPAPRGERGC
jgi:hypothetical protein